MYRCRVYDRRSRRQIADSRFHDTEHRFDIRPEGALPLLRGEIFDSLDGYLSPGIVDQGIEPAQFFRCLSGHVRAVIGIGEVTGEGNRSAPRLANHLAHMLGIGFFFGQIGQSHIRTLSGEGDGNG